MTIVNRPPFLDTAEYAAWETRASKARDAMLKSDKPPAKFNEGLWQSFKNEFLIPLGRCAYCEGRYTAGEFGDAEHYRPKGEVTQARQKVKDHPGYYWLAYEWHNLLLACKKCNSKHPDRDNSTPKKKVSHEGKLCEFPVVGERLHKPSADPSQWIDELLTERPLLLNPYFDRAEDHFEARLDGWIYQKSERGRITIDVCDLNRRELRDERRNSEAHAKAKAVALWNAQPHGVDWTKDSFGPNVAFSTYLNCKVREELKRQLIDFQEKMLKFG